jgi:hypothetical protein
VSEASNTAKKQVLSERHKAALEIQREALHEAFEAHRVGDYDTSKKIVRAVRRWARSIWR